MLSTTSHHCYFSSPSPHSYSYPCSHTVDLIRTPKPLPRASNRSRHISGTKPTLGIHSDRWTSQCKEEKRREVFLRKIDRAREDSRWGWRGDQILQRDYVSQQRNWEERQGRSAPEPAIEFEDQEGEMLAGVSSKDDSSLVDEILQQESQDLEALVSLIEEESDSPTMELRNATTSYGSDNDDAYQSSCLKAVSEPETNKHSADEMSEALLELCQDMEMDMSPD